MNKRIGLARLIKAYRGVIRTQIMLAGNLLTQHCFDEQYLIGKMRSLDYLRKRAKLLKKGEVYEQI